MLKKFLSHIIFLLFFGAILAQNGLDTIKNDGMIRFSGFTESPVKANSILLKKLQKATNFNEKGKAILELSKFHIEKGNIDSIIFYGKYLYDESLLTKEVESENEYFLASSANIIAIGKRMQGLNDVAIKWHIKGITHAESIPDIELINKHKFGMGIVYAMRKDYSKALEVFDKCILNTTDTNFKYDVYKRKADIYVRQEKIQKAKEEYVRVLAFYKTNNAIKRELEVLLKLGVIAEIKGDNTKAFNYYNEVKDRAEAQEYYDLYFRTQNRIGRLYFVLKQFKNAHIALSTSYMNAIQWDNLEYQKEILNNLRRVYYEEKDYENAYAVMTQYIDISNRILKKQNKKEITELEVQYKTLQKENQIQVLENEQTLRESEIKRQKTLKMSFLIGFIVILIPVIALLYMYYQKLQTQSKLTKIQEEVNEQKVETLLKDQELKLIKADIDGQDKERKRIAQELHDSIGGSLAGIKLQLSNTAKDDENYKRIAKQIDETYNQVRDLSHTLIPKKFNENIFTALIEHYIENIQKDNQTQIIFSPHPKKEINAIDETLKVELFKIIQELITNVFKHAKASQISIHLNKFEDNITLLFEDDGIGFDMKKHKKGIGLTNIKSRIEGLSGTMRIDSFLNRGTVIDIDIPLINKL